MPTHSEKRVLPYSPRQLFELVANVEDYPVFLPWCLASRITKREGSVFFADLIIGYKMVREKFTSKVTADKTAKHIHVEYLSGPMRYLSNHWRFAAHKEGCEIDFYVDFEFKNPFFQSIMGAFFEKAVEKMVAAFEGRAKELYG